MLIQFVDYVQNLTCYAYHFSSSAKSMWLNLNSRSKLTHPVEFRPEREIWAKLSHVNRTQIIAFQLTSCLHRESAKQFPFLSLVKIRIITLFDKKKDLMCLGFICKKKKSKLRLVLTSFIISWKFEYLHSTYFTSSFWFCTIFKFGYKNSRINLINKRIVLIKPVMILSRYRICTIQPWFRTGRFIGK